MHILSPYTKIRSKWIKDLNLKPDMLKLLEKSIGSTLQDTGIEEHFINRVPLAKELRPMIDKWDLSKSSNPFCWSL